jgi:tetratricopeptide (TPR) repeat protein
MPRLRPPFTLALSCLATLLLLAGCAQTPQQKYARFLQRGKRYLEKSDSTRATLEFRNAIQQQPKVADGYYWLAQAFLSENKVADAVVALRRATELKPGHAAAELKLAELMIRSRDEQLLKEAETRIQKILTGSPADEDALFTLAAAQAQLGKTEDAEKYLSDVVKRSPSNLRSQMALALLKVSQKDLTGGEQVLKAAIQQVPGSDDAVVALANLYVGMDRFPEAEPLFLKGVQLNPDNSDAWIALGSMQLKAGNTRVAEESFKRAAEASKTKAPLAYIVFLIRQNRRPQAIATLEKMAKADPDNHVIRSALVAGYLTVNRQPEAETILNDAIRKNPHDVEALLQHSQISYRKHNCGDALADLDKVLIVSPDSPQAHFLRSRVFLVRDDQVKRIQDLKATLRSVPDSAPARFDLADALVRTNKAREAIQTLDGGTDDQKRTLAFAVAYNWALIGAGEVAAARKGVDRALAASKNPQLMLQDGVLKYAARDFAGAKTSLEKVLHDTPDDARALSLLADTYVAQNQRSAATEKLRQFAREQPGALPIQMLWARWLIRDEQTVEARKTLTAVIAANPKSTEPLLVSAGMDFNEGQMAGARSTLKNLLRLDDKNIEAYMLAGQVEEASANYRDAMEFYRKALALDGSNVFSLNNLAYLLSRDPARIEEALGLARKAKDQVPDSPEVLDTLGWLYYRKGMYDLAAQELERALSKADWPAIQFHLGLAYNRLGNTEKGRRLLAAALAKDPKLADADGFR